MKVLYHHRTRATDAQRIHIQEIIRAFRQLGHEVREASLVDSNTATEDAERDASEAGWKTMARRIPGAYDLIQLGYNAVGIPLLFWRALRYGPAVIYERYSLFNFAGVIVGKLLGVPVVLEVNSPFALEQERDKDITFVKLAWWSERVICNLATKVIVVSTPLKKIMEKMGVRSERLLVMPNGVNLESFRMGIAGPEIRAKYGLQGKRLVFGFVGWFRDWHKLDMFLEAFYRSGLASSGAAVLMVGGGPEMERLQEYAKSKGLQDSVKFTGPLPHGDVPAALDLFDVAVQPAANEYCCPMKIIEYLAMGKPVVAPRQMNIEELVDDGANAVMFTPGDAESFAAALRKMGEDEAVRAAMGKAAKDTIARRGFLWTANAERVIALAAGR